MCLDFGAESAHPLEESGITFLLGISKVSMLVPETCFRVNVHLLFENTKVIHREV